MSYLPRIIYNNINIDLVRKWHSFQDDNINRMSTVITAAGIEEDLIYFNRDLIEAFRRNITAQEIIELRQWYEYIKNGASFELLRDVDLGTMIGFEGKTLKDINEVDATFTRALTTDSSSYLDPSTGLLTFVNTVNIARFPAGKFGSGVLIEGARTNIITRSESFNLSWTKADISVAADTTETKDPFGNNNAERLSASSPNGTITFGTSTSIGSDDAVFSVWLKLRSGTDNIPISIRSSSAGELATTTATVTPTWQRFQIAYEGVSPGGNWQARIEIPGVLDVIYAFAGQLEVGSDVLFASRYIKANAGSSVSRGVDKLLYATANVVNQEKGTVAFWINSEWIYNKHSNATLFDSRDTFRHFSIVFLSGGNIEIRMDRNNSSTIGAGVGPSGSSLGQNAWHHIAATYDSTISNSLKLYLDGVKLGTSSNDAFVPNPVGTNYAIGSQTGGSAPAFAVFDDFFIRKDVLNDSDILSIFNRGVGLGEQRNRWSALKLVEPTFNPVRKAGVNRYDFHLLAKEELT